MQGAEHPHDDLTRRRDIVHAFLEASQQGNFTALLALLDPEVTLRADPAVIQTTIAHRNEGAPALAPEIHGAVEVAGIFKGRARHCRSALIDGGPGLVLMPEDRIRIAFEFIIEHDRVTGIDLIADPNTLAGMQIALADQT